VLNSGRGCRKAAQPCSCLGIPRQVAGQQAAAGGLQELDPDEKTGLLMKVSVAKQSAGPCIAVTVVPCHASDVLQARWCLSVIRGCHAIIRQRGLNLDEHTWAT
jgi:hypothetical protein